MESTIVGTVNTCYMLCKFMFEDVLEYSCYAFAMVQVLKRIVWLSFDFHGSAER
jgi:hypothetical protein